MKTSLSLFIVIFSFIFSLSLINSHGDERAGHVTVQDTVLPVYARMSARSAVVKTLKKGDAVTVEVELEMSGHAWCGIREEGRTETTGYVQCALLERNKVQQGAWQRVGSAARNTTNVAGNITTVDIVRNQVLVPITLGNGAATIQATLLLDTGANCTTINTEIAEQLGLNPGQLRKNTMQVAGGGLIDMGVAKLSHVTVGPHTKNDMRICVIEHKGPQVRFDGLLGMDFLRTLKYEIDFSSKTIHWAR